MGNRNTPTKRIRIFESELEEMRCKHLTVRSNKGTKYYFCRLKKQQLQLTLEQCKKCPKFECKMNKQIKNKSNKLSKLEKKRFSILTDDLEHCFICKELDESLIPKDDLHEIYPR